MIFSANCLRWCQRRLVRWHWVDASAFIRSNPEGWHIPPATPEHLSLFKGLGRIHSGDKPVTMRRFAPSLLC